MENYLYNSNNLSQRRDCRWYEKEVHLRDMQELPLTDQWLIDHLRTSIRLNIEGDNTKLYPGLRELNVIQSKFNPSDLPINPIYPAKYEKELPGLLWSILSNNKVRRGKFDVIAQHSGTFLEKLNIAVTDNTPVELVLPTLPFKNRNQINTRQKTEQIDLGEYLFMAQLRDIVYSVQSIYPPGVLIHLISDGLAYQHIFSDSSSQEIKEYTNHCLKIRDNLGLADVIDIVDMKSLVLSEPQAQQRQDEIWQSLVRLESENIEITGLLHSLRLGMLHNIPSWQYSFEEALHFTSLDYNQLPSEVKDRVNYATYSYASFLLMLQSLQIIDRAYSPNTIRASVHVKPDAHLPLHLVNKHSAVLPYNGVPVVSQSSLESKKNIKRATRIMRFYQALHYKELTSIEVDGYGGTFYYLID